jgi:hypothetical protein
MNNQQIGESSADVVTRARIAKLKVQELKDECRTHGLGLGGNKPELAQRLAAKLCTGGLRESATVGEAASRQMPSSDTGAVADASDMRSGKKRLHSEMRTEMLSNVNAVCDYVQANPQVIGTSPFKRIASFISWGLRNRLVRGVTSVLKTDTPRPVPRIIDVNDVKTLTCKSFGRALCEDPRKMPKHPYLVVVAIKRTRLPVSKGDQKCVRNYVEYWLEDRRGDVVTMTLESGIDDRSIQAGTILAIEQFVGIILPQDIIRDKIVSTRYYLHVFVQTMHIVSSAPQSFQRSTGAKDRVVFLNNGDFKVWNMDVNGVVVPPEVGPPLPSPPPTNPFADSDMVVVADSLARSTDRVIADSSVMTSSTTPLAGESACDRDAVVADSVAASTDRGDGDEPPPPNTAPWVYEDEDDNIIVFAQLPANYRPLCDIHGGLFPQGFPLRCNGGHCSDPTHVFAGCLALQIPPDAFRFTDLARMYPFSAAQATPKTMRAMLYYWYATNIYGTFGRGNRACLPLCLVSKIRELYPNASSVPYVGHKDAVNWMNP